MDKIFKGRETNKVKVSLGRVVEDVRTTIQRQTGYIYIPDLVLHKI